MKINIANIKSWWTAHQKDRDEAVTFIHKYPMQIVVLLVILLLLLGMHSCSQSLRSCDKAVSVQLVPPPPEPGALPAPLLGVPSPAVVHVAYAMGREDGGTAFFVPMEDQGTTTLIDEPFNAKPHVVGRVINFPSAMGTIVEIGDVRIGVKPYGRYQ